MSDKYILACDSVTFVVKPRYYDFYTRGLMPVHHYWPIKENDKCRSIKFAVDWGNNHKQKVIYLLPLIMETRACCHLYISLELAYPSIETCLG